MDVITIILTTYNAEETLQRTLDSVARQDGLGTRFDTELIVVDDCSTDRTREILDANGIPYLSTERNTGGPNRGRNLGLHRATGEWISLLDHDDEWHEDRLSRLLDLAGSASVPLLSSGFTVHDAVSGKRTQVRGPQDEEFTRFERDETFRALLRKEHGGQITYLGSLLVHASLGHIGFEEVKGRSDFDWILKVFEGRSSAQINDPLFVRYQHGSNLSMDEQYRRDDHELAIRSLKSYAVRFPSDVSIGVQRVHGTLARYYYEVGNFRASRTHFRKAPMTLKTLLYYLTSFVGHRLVKRFFRVFR